MKETNIMRSILLALGQSDARLFRQNVGTGWAGKKLRLQPGQSYVVKHGDVVIQNARPLRAGLCEGSSDLIGWRQVVITPDMVGTPVAVFTALEVKTPKGRATKEQANFLDVVQDAGGFAGIVRSVADALKTLAG